jgi:hypothetical protein
MRQDLGARPDPNRDPTRKEKFTELMNFGLQLMQNAKRGNDPVAAVGASAQEALGAQKAKQQGQTADYDSRVAGIEGQRQNQLKDIGNYGQAMREDVTTQDNQQRTAADIIRTLKPPRPGQPTTRVLQDGTQVDYDPQTGSWNPSVDRNGNPLGKVNPQGPHGGAGKGSARVQSLNDLIAKGVDKNRAMMMVYGTGGFKPDDPIKTYNAIYSKARGLFESPEDAAQEAESQTSMLHGPNWRDTVKSRNAPPTGGSSDGGSPPVSALKAGQNTKFKNGQTWTLGPNGQPKRVS